MSTTAVAENQITITEQIFVKASLETTFKSLLMHLGPMNETPEGKPGMILCLSIFQNRRTSLKLLKF